MCYETKTHKKHGTVLITIHMMNTSLSRYRYYNDTFPAQSVATAATREYSTDAMA
jgi:hypothetical protein